MDLKPEELVRLYAFIRQYPCKSAGVMEDVSNIMSTLKPYVVLEELGGGRAQFRCDYESSVNIDMTRDEIKCCNDVVKWAMSKDLITGGDTEILLPLIKKLDT